MTRKTVSALGIVLFVVMSAVSPAWASLVETVYRGAIGSGTDVTGVFGRSDTSLAGERYTAIYIYNTDIGYSNGDYPLGQGFALGGTDFTPPSPASGYPSPIVSATLKINGHSITINGNAYGVVWADAGQQRREAYEQDFRGGNVYVYATLSNSITDPTDTIPENAIGPSKYNVESGDIANGSFVFEEGDEKSGQRVAYAYAAILVPQSVSIIPLPSVPETATWTMMALGFAGLAFGGYRGYRKAKPLAL